MYSGANDVVQYVAYFVNSAASSSFWSNVGVGNAVTALAFWGPYTQYCQPFEGTMPGVSGRFAASMSGRVFAYVWFVKSSAPRGW